MRLEGSFSPAARKLWRTQPAVSQAISRLEASAGERLIDRSSRMARSPTPGPPPRVRHPAPASGRRGNASGRTCVRCERAGSGLGRMTGALPRAATHRRVPSGVSGHSRGRATRPGPSDGAGGHPARRRIRRVDVQSSLAGTAVGRHRPRRTRAPGSGDHAWGKRDIMMEEMGREVVIAHNDPSPQARSGVGDV